MLAEIDPESSRGGGEIERPNGFFQGRRSFVQGDALEAKQARVRAEELAKEGLVSKKDLEVALRRRRGPRRIRKRQGEREGRSSFTQVDAIQAGKDDHRCAHRRHRPRAFGRTRANGDGGISNAALFRLADDLTKLALHVDIDEAESAVLPKGRPRLSRSTPIHRRRFPSKVRSLRNETKKLAERRYV